jgi:hypothetical protein
MPRAKANVRTVRSWGERKAVGGAAVQVTPVRPVQAWTGSVLGFVLVQVRGLFLEVVVLVVGLESLQVVRLLGVPPLEFTTGMGGVVALRRRGGTFHGLSFVVLVLLQAERGGSLRGGYRGGVRGGSFGRRDALVGANPTFEQMARHWFYSFGTNPIAESFVGSRARF